MKIAHIIIDRFRGIKKLEWYPKAGINCLIGPGDSAKTTILDAIELVMNPRFGFAGTDADFFGCDTANFAEIMITLIDLPVAFFLDNKYGLYLRGWDAEKKKISDEKSDDEIDALSIQACLDPSTLEWRWSVFNDRIDPDNPPSFKAKDARETAPTRLGVYADRDLAWGRYSALSRIAPSDSVAAELVNASREARDAFAEGRGGVFEDAVKLAHNAGTRFSVPRRTGYSARLDIQTVAISTGTVSLHDGPVPLRALGTGSSRLLVAGLQHQVRSSSISLIDEIEYGLEPHRISRLLRLLRADAENGQAEEDGADRAMAGQVFMTTHSPVVVRELKVRELLAVRSNEDGVSVRSVEAEAGVGKDAQRHVRATPEAFLAPRIIVGEGRTECGLLRGLDDAWTASGKNSFAYEGVVAVDGTGKDSALSFAEHLLKLGYQVLVLLDSDQPVKQETKEKVTALGGTIEEWADKCSTEQRVFLDVPWETLCDLVSYAVEERGEHRILKTLNAALPEGIEEFENPDFTDLPDTLANRELLGRASTLKVDAANGMKKDWSWFKDITRGEGIAAIVSGTLGDIPEKPLAQTLARVRDWVDGGV